MSADLVTQLSASMRTVPEAKRIDMSLTGVPETMLAAWRCEEDGKWKSPRELSYSIIVEDFGAMKTRGGLRVKQRFLRGMIVCGACHHAMLGIQPGPQ